MLRLVKNYVLASFLLGACTLHLACDPEATPEPITQMPAEVELARELLLASAAFGDLYQTAWTLSAQIDALNERPTGATRPSSACVQITEPTSAEYPKRLVLGFGESCTTVTGHPLTGQLVAVWSGPMHVPGSTVTLQLKQIRYDGYDFDGRLSATVIGDGGGAFRTRVDLVDGAMSQAGELLIRYDETVFSRLVSGGDSDFASDGMAGLLDDVWEDTRAGTGYEAGFTYALTSPSPQQHSARCAYPTRGALLVAGPSLEGELGIDLSDEGCDGSAVVRYLGERYEIEL